MANEAAQLPLRSWRDTPAMRIKMLDLLGICYKIPVKFSKIWYIMVTKLGKIMEKFLISDSELAREAKVHERTVKNAKKNSQSIRVQTKRALLNGLNKILKDQKKKPVDAEIFK